MKNIRLAKKYGAKTVAFKNLPQSHQLAIAWYMTIDSDGEAWKVMGKLEEDFEKVRPSDYSNEKKWKKFQEDLKRLLIISLPAYVKKYGHIKFGVAEIPTMVLVKEICNRESEVPDAVDTIKKYRSWYKKDRKDIGDTKFSKHPKTNRWPCILSDFDDEVLQDGWHRFFTYAGRGDKKIPCVFYT